MSLFQSLRSESSYLRRAFGQIFHFLSRAPFRSLFGVSVSLFSVFAAVRSPLEKFRLMRCYPFNLLKSFASEQSQRRGEFRPSDASEKRENLWTSSFISGRFPGEQSHQDEGTKFVQSNRSQKLNASPSPLRRRRLFIIIGINRCELKIIGLAAGQEGEQKERDVAGSICIILIYSAHFGQLYGKLRRCEREN